MNKINEAFSAIKRENFLPSSVRDSAELDMPLPIGFGVTNSQPYTVKLMLKWLDVKPAQNILDVGSGSGWTTALLSTLTGSSGKITATEIIPELVIFGRQNCNKIGIKNVDFFQAGEEFGYKANAPYDRILVSASASDIPDSLIKQLRPGGKMVIPVNESIYEITKTKNGDIKKIEHFGFAFVPLL